MKSSILLRRFLAIAGSGILATPLANASTLYWDGAGANVNWSTLNNWGTSNADTLTDPAAIPTSADDVVFHSTGATQLTTNIIDTAFTLQSLTFGNSRTDAVTIGGTGVLTLNGKLNYDSSPLNSGTVAGITNTATLGTAIYVQSGSGAATISAPITLGAAQQWVNNSANILTIQTGALTNGANNLTIGGTGNTTISSVFTGSGAGGLTKVGAGILTLSGENTYSGGTTLSAGTLNINNGGSSSSNSAIGTGTFTIAGGTIDNTAGAVSSTITLATNNALALNADFAYTGTGSRNLNLGTGAVTMAATRTITVNGGSLTIGGNIASTTAGITKAGAGTLNLTGANSYTGTTTISGGTLQVGDGTTGSLNGTTGTALTISDTGAFNVMEAAGISQGMGALTFTAGSGTVTSTYAGSGNTTLTFASMAARAAGATANFTLAGAGSTATNNKIVLTSTTNAPLDTSGSNDRGIFFGGSNYARYSTANGTFQSVVYGTDNNTNAQITGVQPTLGTTTSATDVQYVATTATVSNVNTASTASTSLTVGDGALFTVGAPLTGTGIPAKTYVTAIAGNVLTLSQAATVGTNAAITPYNSVSAQTTGTAVNTLHLSGVGSSLRLAGTLTVNGILLSGGDASVANVISGGTSLATTASNGEMVIRTDTASDTLLVTTPIVASGTSSLTKTGAGTVILSGANTYTGSTRINSGTLQIGNGGTTGALSTSSAIVVNGSGNLTINRSDNVAQGAIFANGISGTGSVTKNNTNTLTLNGAHTYSGGFILNAGTVDFNNSSAFGTGLITVNGGTFALRGATNTANNSLWNASFALARGTAGNLWTHSGNVTLGANITLSSGQSDVNVAINGIIGETTGISRSLTLSHGGSAFTLNNANTYSGGTSLTGALTLSLGNNSALGTGTFNINAGTIQSTDSTARTFTNAVTIGGNFIVGGTGNLTFSNTAASALGGNRQITVTNSGTTATFAQAFSGANSITKAGAGTLVLSGTNSHSGGTTNQIANSRVIFLGAAALGSGGTTGALTSNAAVTSTFEIRSDVSYNKDIGIRSFSGANMNLVFDTQTAISASALTYRFSNATNGMIDISGDATVNFNAGAIMSGTPTVQVDQIRSQGGNTNGTATINATGVNLNIGTLTATAAGANFWALGGTSTGNTVTGAISHAVIKNGTGTWTLSGTNVYTGGTAINGGTLALGINSIQALGGSGTIGSVGTITFGGGTLQYGASNTTDYSSRFGSGVNQFRIDTNGLNVTFNSQIIGTANASTFTKLGAGTLTLNSAVSRYTGVTTIGGGTLNANTLADGGADSSIGTSTNIAANVVIAGGTLQHDAANVATTDRLFTIGDATALSATLDSSAVSTTNIMDFTNAGALGLGGSGARTLTLQGSNTGANSLAAVVGDGTGGSTALVKAGAGSWKITGTNTFTGNTTISGGILEIGGGGSLGSGSYAGTIANSGTLKVNTTENQTLSGEISLGGTVEKDNIGTLTLTGTNTYTGATNVSGGTLIINGSNASTSLSVANGATLGGSGAITGATTISGLHSPGNSPGIQPFGGDLAYNNGGSVLWELVGNTTAGRGTSFDGINVGGALAFNAAVPMSLSFIYAGSLVDWDNPFWASSYTGTSGWLVYNGATLLTGFDNLSITSSNWADGQGDLFNTDLAGASFSLYQDGNNIYLNYAAIPEPNVAALLGSLGMLALLRRRRN